MNQPWCTAYITKLCYFIRIKGKVYRDCYSSQTWDSRSLTKTTKENLRYWTEQTPEWKTPSITFLYDWHNSHIKCTSCKTREGNEIEKDSFSLLCYAIKTHFPFFHVTCLVVISPRCSILFCTFLGFLFYYNKPFPVKHCVFKKNRAIFLFFIC